jgi:hypothetical protein
MFDSAPFEQMYKEFLGPLARPVLLAFNNGTGFNVYPPRTAWITAEKTYDSRNDSSLQDETVRMVMLADQMPVGLTKMELKDRVIIDDRFYSTTAFDPLTRAIGGKILAYNITLRLGGKYVSGGLYRIVSELGEPLITEADNFGMITE